MEAKRKYNMDALLNRVNHCSFRRSVIPMELAAGWPCLRNVGGMLGVTVPYFARRITSDTIELYPICCALTVLLDNPDQICDYTVLRYQPDWADVNLKEPCGYFKHEALKGVDRDTYREMCRQLYACYDNMAYCVQQGIPFEKADEMTKLFSVLMEPGLYPYYRKLNKKFYAAFCKL